METMYYPQPHSLIDIAYDDFIDGYPELYSDIFAVKNIIDNSAGLIFYILPLGDSTIYAISEILTTFLGSYLYESYLFGDFELRCLMNGALQGISESIKLVIYDTTGLLEIGEELHNVIFTGFKDNSVLFDMVKQNINYGGGTR